MAYMNQERKAARAEVIKKIAKKYDVKVSLSVRNHTTLVATISKGSIDFIGNYNKLAEESGRRNPVVSDIGVNPYYFNEHFDGKAAAFLEELIAAMYGEDYFDKSDSQVDYFHTSHYIDVNIGRWNKPYELVA